MLLLVTRAFYVWQVIRLRRQYFMSQMAFFFTKENFCTSDRYCCAFCSWAQLENLFVQCRQDFPSKACEGTSRLRPIFTSSPPNLSSRFPQWIDFYNFLLWNAYWLRKQYPNSKLCLSSCDCRSNEKPLHYTTASVT